MKTFSGLEKLSENFLKIDLDLAKGFFDIAYIDNRSEKYKNVAMLTPFRVKEYSFLSKALSSIKEQFDIGEYTLRKVWLVKSESETIDKGMLPFIPHIDKERYLKFMIYVTDVTEKDGPFYSCEKVQDVEKYEDLRQKVKDSKKDQKLNEIRDFSIESYKPVLGSSGDLVIFDTNIPHFAGAVEKGHVRKVIRFDFEKKEWNKKSFKSKIKSLFNP